MRATTTDVGQGAVNMNQGNDLSRLLKELLNHNDKNYGTWTSSMRIRVKAAIEHCTPSPVLPQSPLDQPDECPHCHSAQSLKKIIVDWTSPAYEGWICEDCIQEIDAAIFPDAFIAYRPLRTPREFIFEGH